MPRLDFSLSQKCDCCCCGQVKLWLRWPQNLTDHRINNHRVKAGLSTALLWLHWERLEQREFVSELTNPEHTGCTSLLTLLMASTLLLSSGFPWHSSLEEVIQWASLHLSSVWFCFSLESLKILYQKGFFFILPFYSWLHFSSGYLIALLGTTVTFSLAMSRNTQDFTPCFSSCRPAMMHWISEDTASIHWPPTCNLSPAAFHVHISKN